MDPQRLPRQTIAEIGRLAVIARYRNRRDEDKSPAPLNAESFGTKERPRFPYLTVRTTTLPAMEIEAMQRILEKVS